jgi:hypothetical protein
MRIIAAYCTMLQGNRTLSRTDSKSDPLNEPPQCRVMAMQQTTLLDEHDNIRNDER